MPLQGSLKQYAAPQRTLEGRELTQRDLRLLCININYNIANLLVGAQILSRDVYTIV
jgi:hypothetical protein